MDRTPSPDVAARRTRKKPGLARLQTHADAVLYRRGLSVGVEEILQAAQVSRGTLYNNLHGKAGLIGTYLDRRHEAALSAFDEAVNASDNVRDAVLAVFAGLAQRAQEDGYRGCAFILASAEDPVLAGPRARRHKEAIRERFAELCAGHVDDKVAVAETLMLLYDGLLVASALRRDAEEPVRQARAAADLILTTHGTP